MLYYKCNVKNKIFPIYVLETKYNFFHLQRMKVNTFIKIRFSPSKKEVSFALLKAL